jgi:hypothetical protein
MIRTGWLVALVGASMALALSVVAAQHRFSQRAYNTQGAAAFVFDQRMFHTSCVDRPVKVPMTRGHSYMTVSPQPAFARTRLEHLDIPLSEAPALTLDADLGAMIQVQGQVREGWAVRMCALGEGDSEAEANGRVEEVALSRSGGTITLSGRGPDAWPRGRAQLTVDAPEDAPVNIYSAYAAIEIHDMTGPVHTAAAHARTIILNSTGRVDATGDLIDFGGTKGTVNLQASSEIELNLTATRFEGTLRATAVRPLRVLLGKGFQTGFQAMVQRREDFVCRADICAQVTSEKKDGRYLFTYAGDGSSVPDRVFLRSEASTVVIDTAGPSRGVHRLSE